MPWNPSQPAMKSQAISSSAPSRRNRTIGVVDCDVLDADILDVEVQRPAGFEPRVDEIAHDLVLSVDRDRAAPRQRIHIDVMARALEREIQAFVAHAFAREALADADLRHEIDRALLEDARAHALDHVLLAAVLDDDRVDALPVEQVPEHEPGRTCADDGDLGAKGHGRQF